MILAIGRGECLTCDKLMEKLYDQGGDVSEDAASKALEELLDHRKKDHWKQPGGSCSGCSIASETRTEVYYYRIGNDELGYGNIGVIGCRDHVKLALDRLNEWKKI